MTKMLARRLFARAAIGVPTALKLGNRMPHPPPHSGGNYLGEVANTALGAEPSLRMKIYDAMRRQMKPEEEVHTRRWTARNMMGGLDPDLSVLNSMSLQHRINRQLDREEERAKRHRGLRATIIRALGGKPEDFE